MARRDVIVVGASAGGVETLSTLAAGLPADLQAAVLVVLHTPPDARSRVPEILSRVGPLPASHPRDGDPLRRGQIYVAPPDLHLIVRGEVVRLAYGPRENGVRPAVDVLFRTAARAHGRRVIGVVLSGALDDGTAGLAAIKRLGGVAVVQNPEEALFPGMPESALANLEVDHCLSVAKMPPLLAKLSGEEVEQEGEPAVSQEMEMESEMADLDPRALHEDQRPWKPSGFSCPECHGSLWELQEDELPRFRCRVGHAFSVETLLAQQSNDLETALWAALRSLEERAALTRQLATRVKRRGRASALGARFEARAQEAQDQAELIRRALLGGLADDREGRTPSARPEDVA